MKKIIILLSFGLFFLNLKAQENALLWKISKDGYQTSYLFGTMHSQDERVFNFSDSLLTALQNVDAYAGEIIMNDEDVLAFIPYMFEKDEEKQVKNILNKKEYKVFMDKGTELLGAGAEILLPNMSPYFAYTLLSMSEIDEFEMDKQSKFLDQYLQQYADSLEKELYSLESIASQMKYLTDIPIKEQTKQLKKYLDGEFDDMEDEFSQIMKYYIAEDLDNIETFIFSYMGKDPLFSREFIVDRNYIQLKGMLEIMETESLFTAVGAAHLLGEEGILNLLKNKGFVLTALPK